MSEASVNRLQSTGEAPAVREPDPAKVVDQWRGDRSSFPAIDALPSHAEKILLRLFQRFPVTQSIFREAGPRAEDEYEWEAQYPLDGFLGLETSALSGRDVLDLGSGFGGRTVRYAECGARWVTGVEVSPLLVQQADSFARSRGVRNVSFLVGSGESIPTLDDQFDLIVMNDVMEHVVSPEEVLRECHRVLRPGGRLALLFPPYYSLRAGSHLLGYATVLPGLNLVFSTAVLRRATLRHLDAQGVEYWRYLRSLPTDKLWNMNGLTARKFKRLVARGPLDAEEILYLGELDHRVLHARPLVKSLIRMRLFVVTELLARTPILQEAFCFRICAILRKAAP